MAALIIYSRKMLSYKNKSIAISTLGVNVMATTLREQVIGTWSLVSYQQQIKMEMLFIL